MADPRNIAHDKTVMDEKKDAGEEIVEGAAVTPQPGKKPPLEKDEDHHEDKPREVNEGEREA